MLCAGVARILLFLPDTCIDNATQLAEKIRCSIEKNSLNIDNTELKITISLGVAICRGHESVETLIDQTDQALLKAKESGRNKVVVDEISGQEAVA